MEFKRLKIVIKLTMILVSTIILILNTNISNTYAATVEPQDDQKIEYRAVSLEETDNGKQLVIELWIKNINFKGMDIRLNYDSTILKPSNINSNEIIDVNEELGIPSCFEFTNEFGNYLDYFAMESTEGEYRGILSLLGEEERKGTNEYLVQDENIGDYVSITGEVLLGRLSFNAGEANSEQITTQTLSLKQAVTSPKTGIKVNINGEDSYENQKLFEFTLSLESNNAYLSNIESDSFALDNFNKETFNYEVDITEDNDVINVTPTLEDEKATMTYNGEPIENNMPFEVTLNPLGESTQIDIVVTAEDGKTQNIYTVTIKRPRRNNYRFNYN